MNNINLVSGDCRIGQPVDCTKFVALALSDYLWRMMSDRNSNNEHC